MIKLTNQEINNKIDIMNSLKVYSFPFKKNTIFARCIVDDNTDFNDFISDKKAWYSETGNKFSSDYMKVLWKVILKQRIYFKASILFNDNPNKFKGVNQAIDFVKNK